MRPEIFFLLFLLFTVKLKYLLSIPGVVEVVVVVKIVFCGDFVVAPIFDVVHWLAVED